ncbi:hypothetical protein EDB81DRAFT_791617 [Dactylonectria macrodidyma]|uniref:C2H2-type domain-containing protein n=1 Tax=Dactylonectria macrodidyma TaxID=307937 RepID=A0A9P9JCB1_9HYPO|nr:hypothetical protein EDB81DRAFT_791617 [Dactylonectria macrodidyma]
MDDKSEICDSAQLCKGVFEKCVADPAMGQHSWLRSAQGDFNLWCVATNATTTGKSSFDYCLRHNQDTQEAICGLIHTLGELVQTCFDVIETRCKAGANTSDTIPDEQSTDHRPESPLSWATSSNTSDALSGYCIEDPLVAEQVLYIKTILSQLSRLAVDVRKSEYKYKFGDTDDSLDESAYDDFRKHLTVVILRAIEDPYAQYLPTSDNIDYTSDWARLTKVQKRLVQANIFRRYRIEKMAGPHEPLVDLALATQQSKSSMKSVDPEATTSQTTTAHTIQQQPAPCLTASRSAPNAEGLFSRPQPLTADVTMTDAGSNLEAQVESNLAQETPSAATNLTRVGVSDAYPTCPRLNSDNLLMCPYCNDSLPVEYAESSNRESWRAHVLQDLSPYSCIFEDCGPAKETFLTSKRLLAHMFEKHSVQRWTCDYCTYDARAKVEKGTSSSRQFFLTADDWIEHVATTHEDLISPQQRGVLVGMNKRILIGPLSCPLCDFVSDRLATAIDDHILDHLHDFSLRALPDTAADTLDDIESRITHLQSVLSHTQSVENPNDDLQYPTTSFEDLSQAIHNIKIPGPHQENRALAMLPNFNEAIVEAWQALAGRLHAMIPIFDDMDPELWLNILNEDIDTLNSLQQYSPPPYCPGTDSWEPFISPKTVVIPPMTTNFANRMNIIYQLEQTIFSRAEPGQQVRVALHGPSRIANQSIAWGLAQKLQTDENFSIFWVDATTTENIHHSLGKIADSFENIIAIDGEASVRSRHLLHYLTWSFSGPWLMVFEGLNLGTTHDLAFEGLLPQATRGSLMFVTSQLRSVALLQSVGVIEVNPRDLGSNIVPFARNPDFVGRSDILDALKSKLRHPEPARNRGRQQTAVLYGEGGFGKTQIAQEYVFWLQEACPLVSVFWISGNGREQFYNAYASIADIFQIPGYDDPHVDLLPLVKEWLESNNKFLWLMVIDSIGSTQLEEDLQQQIPECAQGSVLITTRRRTAAGSFTRHQTLLEVGRMNEAESKELAKRLGSDGIERPYPCPRFSLDEISAENKLASELLSLMSFFHEDAIPDEFLSYFSGQQQGPKGDLDLAKALSVLKHHSLVIENRDDRLDMQRTLQLEMHGSLFNGGRMSYFAGQALLAVSHCYPFGQHENRTVCSTYLEHAYAVLRCEGTGSGVEKASRATLLHSVAGFLFYRGQWDDAKKLQQEAVELRREILGPEDPDTLASMDNLASTYQKTGQWDDAEKVLVQAVETSSKVLGPEHTKTLSIMSTLASTYQGQGRLEEAEKLETRVMKTRQKMTRKEHPITLDNTFSFSASNDGNVFLPADEEQEAKHDSEEQEDPDTLASMSNLASIHHSQGRWWTAERYQMQAMEGRTKLLGEEHPDTLSSMNDLALIWESQGRLDDALGLMRKAKDLRQKILGPEHRYTVSSIKTLRRWEVRKVGRKRWLRRQPRGTSSSADRDA